MRATLADLSLDAFVVPKGGLGVEHDDFVETFLVVE